MEFTKDMLAELVTAKTKEHWDDFHMPYLLSDVAPYVMGEGFKYKDLISPQTLKQWISTISDKVKLVQHPNRKARVGIIPPGEFYEFENETTPRASAAPKEEVVGKTYSRSNKYVVMNFLQALSTLDREDVEKVVIPASVLAKLLKEK